MFIFGYKSSCTDFEDSFKLNVTVKGSKQILIFSFNKSKITFIRMIK